ncbi:MAG: DUF1559 domain-containing protein [Pirellulales bacterium]|nr:DUF1559 domain-containing protein [Pirellulales bacterium]
MNALGIALLWCVVQVTLVGLLVGGLYILVRRIRPAAAVPVVLTGLVMVVILSFLALSPWPRWVVRGSTPAGGWGIAKRCPSDPEPGVSICSNPSHAAGAETTPESALVDNPAELTAPSSGATVFWQTLLEELSRPQPSAQPVAWRWPTVVALLLLVAMICGLGRLVLGMAAVRKERLRSRPVLDGRLIELVDVLRAELGCRRSVEVRQCDDLATPATIGWRRPVLLVPSDWTTWTADECRAVLAHELAHVRSHDCLFLLLGQFGVALHFYHPLVHWLSGRLRLEQELAADAAAARISGGQRPYLMTIARLALRGQDRPLPWPARTFLPTRSTFLRRIAMLRDSKLSFKRLSPAVHVVLVGMVLFGGFLAAGLRGPSWQAQALAEEPAESIGGTLQLGNVVNGDMVPTNDLSFVSPSAHFLVIMRSVDGTFSMAMSPESILPNAQQLDKCRQITTMEMSKNSSNHPDGIMVYQSIEPLAVSAMIREGETGVALKQLNGKPMVVVRDETTYVQYNDRTVIRANSEEVMRAYLATKLGTLPPWLSKKTWEPFRDDLYVFASDMSVYRNHGQESIQGAFMDGGPLAILATLSPVWENSTCLVAGYHGGDTLQVHATAVAQNEKDAETILKTVESARTLSLNLFRGLAKRSMEQGPSMEEFQRVGPLLFVEPWLEALRFNRESTMVRAEASVHPDQMKKVFSAVTHAQQAAQRIGSVNQMKQLGLAMHNYASARGHFPPAVLYGPDGKTPYSWRVAILPYIEQQGLYDEYHFDEPWDSPANRKVLAKMPDVFRSPTEPAGSTNACSFALTGPGTMFEGPKGIDPQKVRDGLATTILLVEAKRDVPWTKPEDIPYDPKKPMPKLGGFHDGQINVVFGDGHVTTLSTATREETLRKVITRNGADRFDERDLMVAPHPK